MGNQEAWTLQIFLEAVVGPLRVIGGGTTLRRWQPAEQLLAGQRAAATSRLKEPLRWQRSPETSSGDSSNPAKAGQTLPRSLDTMTRQIKGGQAKLPIDSQGRDFQKPPPPLQSPPQGQPSPTLYQLCFSNPSDKMLCRSIKEPCQDYRFRFAKGFCEQRVRSTSRSKYFKGLEN